MLKTVARALAVLLAAALVVGAVAWAYLERSLPRLEGTVRVPGLAQPVDVVRDAEGVPHLYAKSARDGWFAMGYVHAQDRLWQMEFQRRIGQGRLAEIMGERAFDIDRLMRTLGIARLAGRIVARLDPATRANAEAYAAGVNAYLASGPVLPVEFHVFGIAPERWKPADTMAWLLVMAWDLSGNWRMELARMRFGAKLGPKRAAEFLPPYPGDRPPPLPDFRRLYAAADALAEPLLAAHPPGESIGSNSWVVSGARSASGKPLLANDPHLGLQAPSLWYLVHVSTPAGNLVGATLPGVPFVVLGRNDHLAWTMTTTNSDTQDLYVERVAPGDPSRYATPKGTAPFEVRDEVIRVGHEARHVRIRATRHGPVISDAVPLAGRATPPGYVLALSWAALTEDNAVLRAGFALDAARDPAGLLAAMRDFTAPHQNVVYADTAGHIGFVAAARVPIRRPDNEAMGREPVPGWDAKYDWQGFLAFDQMPMSLDPASGRIVTANHKVTPPGYRPFLTTDWYPPYRARRIEALLEAQPKHTVDSFAAIQHDTLSYLATRVLPVARAAHPATQEGRRVQALLAGWHGAADRDLAAPLAFAGWYRELTRLVYADELGDLFAGAWDQRATFMIAVLDGDHGEQRWCDDVRTPEVETCAALAGKAFDLAAVDLERRYGKPSGWRWGRAHYAAGDHRPFGFVRWLAPFFDVDPPTPGDSYSVDVGHFFIGDALRPYANRHAPSLRAIYDLADLDRSRFIQSTGQSGNVLSPWYASFAARWADGGYITIPTRRAALRDARTLTLVPGAQAAGPGGPPPAAPS